MAGGSCFPHRPDAAMSASPSAGARRRYRNPPIEEAVCEFRFRPGRDWDLTIPGKLHSQLAHEYAGPPREQRTTELTVEGDGSPSGSATVRQGISRVQLVTADARRLVGVGKDVLSVHLLRPYQPDWSSGGWEEFRRRITEAVRAYWSVADPLGIFRIALRYINRVELPGGLSDASRFVRYELKGPKGLPEMPLRYFMSRDYRYGDGVELHLRYGTPGLAVNPSEAFLDIEVVWEAVESIGETDAAVKTDLLRDRERRVFESLITDSARESFDAS